MVPRAALVSCELRAAPVRSGRAGAPQRGQGDGRKVVRTRGVDVSSQGDGDHRARGGLRTPRTLERGHLTGQLGPCETSSGWCPTAAERASVCRKSGLAAPTSFSSSVSTCSTMWTLQRARRRGSGCGRQNGSRILRRGTVQQDRQGEVAGLQIYHSRTAQQQQQQQQQQHQQPATAATATTPRLRIYAARALEHLTLNGMVSPDTQKKHFVQSLWTSSSGLDPIPRRGACVSLRPPPTRAAPTTPQLPS